MKGLRAMSASKEDIKDLNIIAQEIMNRPEYIGE